jgi:ADP-heptose:LPS heptosyltransferase
MHTILWKDIDEHTQAVLGPRAKPGVAYLAEDDVTGSYMHAYSNTIQVNKWGGYTQLLPDTDYNGKKVMVMRAGGIGDILFLTPAMAAFKRRNPQAELFFASMAHCPLLLYNNPALTGFLPYPCPLEQVPEHVVCVESMIEFSPQGKLMHAVDLFATGFGLELGPDEKKMLMYLSEEETDSAKKFLPPPGKGKYRFGIQVVANLPVRTYPHMARVAKSLMKQGHQVIAFGAPGQPPIQGAINTHGQTPPLNIRQSASLVSVCDCIIAPDSAITHIAGALDVPCVAVYGSFPSLLRTAYQPKTIAIQGEGKCAPCMHHGRMSNFPLNCPSQQEGMCQVLERISVEAVRDQALRWAFEWKKD